jgi:cytochrome c2
MKIRYAIFCPVLLLAFSLALAAWPQAPASAQKVSKAAKQSGANADEGERRFRQNCGRCHTVPESISPREVKAVLQHMRVRAMLTDEDERLILKYLAP